MIGTKNFDYKQFQTLLRNYTGGIDVNQDSYAFRANDEDFNSNLLIQTAFLDSNMNKAFTYFGELIATPNFDNKTNLSDCIKMSSVEKANELGNKSLEYGLSYADSGIKNYALQNEKL